MPQTWMITGANRGIGLALATALVERGDHVVAAARHPETAALTSLAKKHPEHVTQLMLDVSSAESVTAAKASLGKLPIDVLFNNAGLYGPRDRQSALDMDFAAWREVFEVNVYAPLRVSQTFLPNVEAAKAGKIATLSSQMGSMMRAKAHAVAYRSSKAAVNMVMRGLADALRPQGIPVLLFHPGWVRTDMGGTAADISVEESVGGLIKLIDAATIAETGSFRDWQGVTLPW